jgi:four helix bundle protein
MHNLKQLKIWNRAIDLATDVYKLMANFPTEQKFGLTSQIRRSAVPIPSNIAEEAGKNWNKEFCYFLGISNGSSFELQTQLIISKKFHLLDELDQLLKMNYTLQNRLNK